MDGGEMKKWTLHILGIVLIVTQGINICVGFQIYSQISDSSNSKVGSVQDVPMINKESPVMTLEQAADYIKVTPEQLRKMIQIEQNELNQRDSFSGEMIPYFKVNDDLFFYRDQLNIWLQYVSIEKVEYNLGEGYRLD